MLSRKSADLGKELAKLLTDPNIGAEQRNDHFRSRHDRVFRRMEMKNSEAPLRKSRIVRREFIKAGAAVTAAIAAPKAGAVPVPSPEPAQQRDLQPWWAARPASPKPNRPVSIDLHTHWLPPTYTKALVDLGKPVANINPLEADLDQRRNWMDEHGVQMHLLALSGDAVWQLVMPEQGANLAQIVNDAALEAHARYPDRFVAAIELPHHRCGPMHERAGPYGRQARHARSQSGGYNRWSRLRV